MPRKICAIGFITALVAFAVLLTSSASLALEACPEPPTSFTTAYTGRTVTFTGRTPEADSYRYSYQVSGATPLNAFGIAVPKCCLEAIQIDDVAYPGLVANPGQGDPRTGWLRGYFQAFVVSLPPNASGEYSFLAKTSTIAETSICMLTPYYECGAIAGPACQVATNREY